MEGAQCGPHMVLLGQCGTFGRHGLIQYPAMMVPSMRARHPVGSVRRRSKSRIVMDPFVGSGTALTETIAAGRSFVGLDINPLADSHRGREGDASSR